MKKARIMLAVIAVVAVVGGGLAVKAKTLGGVIYCSTTKSDHCPVKLNYTITPFSGVTSFCTTDPVAVCNLTYITPHL
ncbi:hypothetical protein CLV51_104403 [Chitinophaga niastensis]|uniref:Uncharacterized protein n=1 Tax=Chitinophaga niastensis TaxID=536980 RepID=A0A2P8HHK2_CHINA|nr:hypothetical protein [Chitinophaga niastensis]PSL45696.1 hypothetical protein CLV51_104403 [Chitinophaga niastensis]